MTRYSRAQDSVAITGAGLHCSFGDVGDVWMAFRKGLSALSMHAIPGVTGVAPVPGAPIGDVSPLEFLKDRKLVKYMNAATSMSVAAAGRALRQASLLDDEPGLGSMGLFVSTGFIAFDMTTVGEAVSASATDDQLLDTLRLGEHGLRRTHPLMPFKMLLNMPLGMVSIALGLKGENFILYPRSGQSGVCIETAVRSIRTGRFERVLVGGVANSFSMLPLFTLAREGRLAESVEAAVPFVKSHRGLAPADIAAFLVLESAEAARARGAKILAVVNSALVSFCGESTMQERYAARGSMWVEAGGDRPPKMLFSSGNSTWMEDRQETLQADALWGDNAPRLASLDGCVGHADSASLLCAMAVATKVVGDHEAGAVLMASADADGSQSVVCVGAPGTLVEGAS